jgi:hypothetical protein
MLLLVPLPSSVQIKARIMAEAGSRSGLGLQLPADIVHGELAVILAGRGARQAAATAGLRQRSSFLADRDEAAIAEAPRGALADTCSVAAAADATEFSLKLLEQLACPAAAHGVFAHLLQWLAQQPHQQQRSRSGQPVAAAAAAVAAFAPDLMSAVFRQQNNLSHKQLVRCSSWQAVTSLSSCHNCS